MPFPYWLVIPPAISVVTLGLHRRSAGRTRLESAAIEARDLVERADLFLLQGAPDECRALLRSAMARLAGSSGEIARRVQIQCLLLEGELHSDSGQRDSAHQAFERAIRQAGSLGAGAERDELDLWSRLDLALLEAHDGGSKTARTLATLLEREPEARSPALLCRLANASSRLARMLHERGDWNGAHARYRAALRLGECVPALGRAPAVPGAAPERQRVAWTLAHSAGARAARELGRAHASLGERERAIEWLDRGIATLDGTDVPYGQVELALTLLERATQEDPRSLEGPARQASQIARAAEVAMASGWQFGRAVAARAVIELGLNRWAEGATDDAARQFRRAFEIASAPETRAVISAVRARTMLGLLHEEHGDAQAAIEELRGAFELGVDSTEVAARHFALIAGCHVSTRLVSRGELEGAGAILDRLESLPAALAPGDRALAAGKVAHARAHHRLANDRREDAIAQLAIAERLGTQAGGAPGADLVRHALGLRGVIALSSQQFSEAEELFRGALATASGEDPETREQAERAGLRHQLGIALLHLSRSREAREEFQAAIEAGVASGRPEGRATAAMAAFLLAEAFDDPALERRRLYERAASLGALSATARGREVAAAVPERLRELAG